MLVKTLYERLKDWMAGQLLYSNNLVRETLDHVKEFHTRESDVLETIKAEQRQIMKNTMELRDMLHKNIGDIRETARLEFEAEHKELKAHNKVLKFAADERDAAYVALNEATTANVELFRSFQDVLAFKVEQGAKQDIVINDKAIEKIASMTATIIDRRRY